MEKRAGDGKRWDHSSQRFLLDGEVLSLAPLARMHYNEKVMLIPMQHNL
ncbi:hypothetical protein [Solibaculum mannosilyticum]